MSLRIAMIGAGGVAQRHAKVLSGLEDVEVVSVTDPVSEAARALAGAVGAEAFDQPERALAERPVDAAYVCVPPFAHGDAEAAVLDRGLPMFVEKPVALDLEVAEQVARRVHDAGIVTGTGYHWRCLDTVERARDLLTETPALLAHGRWLDKRPPVDWWQRRHLSGGQVVEQLAHILDLARHLLGEPVEVTAAAANDGEVEEDHVDDATAVLARFDSGAVVTLSASCALTAKRGAGLELVAPGLHLDLAEDRLVVTRGTDAEEHTPSSDPREEVDRDFVAAVRGERPAARVPYADALASHRFALAIARSVRSGGTVRMDEVVAS